MCSQCGNVVAAFVVNKWYDYAIYDWDAEIYCQKCLGKYKFNLKLKDSNNINVSNTDNNKENNEKEK